MVEVSLLEHELHRRIFEEALPVLTRTQAIVEGPGLFDRQGSLCRSGTCPSSKPDPHEFIGGFERSAIGCHHGDADERSAAARKCESGQPS